MLGRLTHQWEENMTIVLQEWDGRAWTRLIWHRIGTGGRLV